MHNDYSASEGYRRMIGTLLGDKDSTQASLYDLWLEVEGAHLLPGRTRPIQMALMPKLSTWKTIMLLGCLLTSGLALLIATKLAWDTTVSHFARQAWLSVVCIYQLLRHSGDSFRHMWRQTRDASLFIVRYTARKVKATVVQLVRSVSRSILGDRDGSPRETPTNDSNPNADQTSNSTTATAMLQTRQLRNQSPYQNRLQTILLCKAHT